MIHEILSSNVGLSALILRVPLGVVLAAHGAQYSLDQLLARKFTTQQ